MAQSGSSNKVANSLVAVSTAAVLAVYAAGYARTRAAAEKFDAQSAERRPAAPEGRGSTRSAPATRQHGQAESAAPVYDWARDQGNTPTQTASIGYAVSPSGMPSALPVTHPPETPASAPEHKPEAASSATLPALAAASTIEPASPAPAVAAPLPAVAVPPAALPSSPQPEPKWKDGTFTGWGTSRHGDIQAAVVIEGGRITSATIAQCLTRYSCNIIAMLPPEVTQRQSGEVDYVSGATQSTNAFYYAVAEALGKAK
jgi:uncharacterized protein with FMN-binding domain